jgi:cobalt-precorrin 5A hydrolase / precorrin-3B C17-methyltransferase
MKKSKQPVVIGRGDHNGVPSKLSKAVDGELILARGENVVPALQAAFRSGRPIVTNIAAPIVIRALAPFLESKFVDPPVVVTSYDGRFVVPLLGISHGATTLAKTIEEKLGWQRVTFGGTASHFNSGTPLDISPDGYNLQNFNDDDYKKFSTSLLDGESVTIYGNAPWLSELPQSNDATLKITITDQDLVGSDEHLVFTSMTLAVGVGCERGTSIVEVQELIDRTLRDNNLAPASVAVYATIDLKEDEPAIRSLTEDESTRFFSADELNAVAGRIMNPSEIVRDEVGTPSVAEASALAAAGPNSMLIVPKTKSARATCAIARAPRPILERRGRAAGSVMIVGIGPGSPETRSPEVNYLIWYATDWVGYGLYLDLISDAKADQTEHRFPLGDEEARCRHAIELAKQGKRVALICSGDAAIYAMAALVYELVDREPNRIAIEVHPGISAFQAASAKAGAIIGHDFCCISLSDLLTPWEAIEKRIKAAAEGDFVISFYNPRSLKRRDQLERAFAILKNHRPPDTPVVVATNLGRPEENVRIRKFSEFDPEEVDMLTLVMVGSSQSKSITRGDGKTYAYTPRGYAKKMDAK